jgi:hypothetical protein
MSFKITQPHHPACAEDLLTYTTFPMGKKSAHYKRLVRRSNGCFFALPTTIPRPAQEANVRTVFLLRERDVRTMGCWLDKESGVF